MSRHRPTARFQQTALKIHHLGGICPTVSLRPLFAILIAVAMLFAPLATPTGSAMAAMPADHHAQMMEKGHCGEQPAKGQDGKAADKNCCVAMCAAAVVALSALVEPQIYHRTIQRPAPQQFGRSFLAELPTPPPRRA
jgi:hypothetical protein